MGNLQAVSPSSRLDIQAADSGRWCLEADARISSRSDLWCGLPTMLRPSSQDPPPPNADMQLSIQEDRAIRPEPVWWKIPRDWHRRLGRFRDRPPCHQIAWITRAMRSKEQKNPGDISAIEAVAQGGTTRHRELPARGQNLGKARARQYRPLLWCMDRTGVHELVSPLRERELGGRCYSSVCSPSVPSPSQYQMRTVLNLWRTLATSTTPTPWNLNTSQGPLRLRVGCPRRPERPFPT